MPIIPNYDQKIQELLNQTQIGEKTCPITGEVWTMTPADLKMYRHFNVPPMAVSPKTFWRQLVALHTAYSWWWNRHAETGKPLLTHIHPHTDYKVITDEEWYQRDFSEINSTPDLNKPFFDQLYQLATTVPMRAWKNQKQPVNAIARISFGDEDSYFVEATISKRCFYGEDSFQIEDSAEFNFCNNVSRSYNLIHSSNIHNSYFVRESRDCLNCSFIFDCRDCENCFMSWNQRHKKFLFYNQQLSETEWREKIKQIDLSSFQTCDRLYKEFKEKLAQETVWPENFNENCQNSSGEYLIDCLNCETCLFCQGAKNARWNLWGNFGSDDIAMGCDPGSTFSYGNHGAINSSGSRFSSFVTRCQNCEYSIECEDCENCFGCVGLRHKKFHILNKEYSENEYWLKVDELKCQMLKNDEYGQMLPQKFALTPYQHSPNFFHLDDNLKQKIGVRQFDPALNGAYGDWSGKELNEIDSLPDKITDIGDEWKGRAFIDHEINRPFSLLGPELEFYRSLGLPVRREHFIKRVEALRDEQPLFEQIETNCQACQQKLSVAGNLTYPNRKIFCHECYLKYLGNQ